MTDIVDRLPGFAVWAVSIADHEAEHLTPRQIERLYEASDCMREAAAEILSLRARIEELERALEGYLSDCSNDECERCISARAAIGKEKP